MCLVIWFLTKTYPVAMAPFVDHTALVFLRSNLMFPEISESLWKSKDPTCLVDIKPIKAAAVERGLLINRLVTPAQPRSASLGAAKEPYHEKLIWLLKIACFHKAIRGS